jgi:chromosome segregation ATPase
MTTILYIILGITIGVGCTLIALQERLLRERRLAVAASAAEQEKSAKLLKEVDDRWEQECEKCKEELAALQDEVINDERVELFEETLLEKESRISTLAAENKQLKESLFAVQTQLAELQSESDFYRGEIRRLEEELKGLPPDDFIVLSGPGGHLLPGSVARALMRRKGS